MCLEFIDRALCGKGPVILYPPAYQRLQSVQNGMVSLGTYIQSAIAGDDEDMDLTFAEGSILISGNADMIEINLEFIKNKKIYAELDGNRLHLFGKQIPEAIRAIIPGKKVNELVDLPAHLQDFGHYRIRSCEQGVESLWLELEMSRIKLDSRTRRLIISEIEMELDTMRGSA